MGCDITQIIHLRSQCVILTVYSSLSMRHRSASLSDEPKPFAEEPNNSNCASVCV